MNEIGSHLSTMGSKVYLIDHLNADELYHRYREEQDPIKRTHLQILWLLTSGRPAKVAAEMTGYSQRWISVLVDGTTKAGLTGWATCAASTPAPDRCSTPNNGSVLTALLITHPRMAGCGPAGGSRSGCAVGSAAWFRRGGGGSIYGVWGSPGRCRGRATHKATLPLRSGSRPTSAPAWKTWRARIRTGRSRCGPSMNIAPALSRSSARSGRAGVSARWPAATSAFNGFMSTASSGRQLAMWSGSWPMR